MKILYLIFLILNNCNYSQQNDDLLNSTNRRIHITSGVDISFKKIQLFYNVIVNKTNHLLSRLNREYNTKMPNEPIDAKINLPNADTHEKLSSDSLSWFELYSLMDVISFFASVFMVFGGVVPYIPQYQMINRSRNATGFSTLVCLSLLVANILRILFWFGHPFEFPLLLQSIIMIVCMIVMLELCVRVKSENFHLTTVTISNKKFTGIFIKYFYLIYPIY